LAEKIIALLRGKKKAFSVLSIYAHRIRSLKTAPSRHNVWLYVRNSRVLLLREAGQVMLELVPFFSQNIL